MNSAHISVLGDAYGESYRQAIDELMDNGLLYATIDLYHFKLVD